MAFWGCKRPLTITVVQHGATVLLSPKKQVVSSTYSWPASSLSCRDGIQVLLTGSTVSSRSIVVGAGILLQVAGWLRRRACILYGPGGAGGNGHLPSKQKHNDK